MLAVAVVLVSHYLWLGLFFQWSFLTWFVFPVVIHGLVCFSCGHSWLGLFFLWSSMTWFVFPVVILDLVCLSSGHSWLGLFIQWSFLTWFVYPVVIQDHKNQKHTCFGRLALTDPWWNITIHLGPKHGAVGPIEYTLRHDLEGIRTHKLVPLLVNKAFQQETKETADIMEAFDEFIRWVLCCMTNFLH